MTAPASQIFAERVASVAYSVNADVAILAGEARGKRGVVQGALRDVATGELKYLVRYRRDGGGSHLIECLETDLGTWTKKGAR